MTYNQSVLNKYRSELLHETYVAQEDTLHVRQHESVQLESSSEQHHQQMMEENTLNDQEKQRANDQIDHNSKNNDGSQSRDVLLLIRRFKSKTCPYCNGQRDANVKHINLHTKPSTPQAFYNDILINKYRHVQSPHAQYNLTLNMDVDSNADKRQESDATMQMENSLLEKECKEEQMQKLAEEKKQCKLEIIQKLDNPSIVLASTATATDHTEPFEQHKLYTNRNSETANVMLDTHESNNKYSPSKLFLLGPMVDQSELPFRMLCREYGATVAFTPMLHAKNFVESAQYRQRFYSTTSKKEVLHALQEQNENLEKKEEHQEEVWKHYEENLCQESCVESCRLQEEQEHEECEEKEQNEELYKCEEADKYMEDKHNKLIDRPLVVQICGNDADTILAAARLVLYSNDYGSKSNDKCDGKKEGHYNSKQKENNEVTANACDCCITTKESKDDQHKQEDAANYNVSSQNVSNNISGTFPLYSCDAVDINLGCPQGIAKRGHYGSFLMED